MSRKGGDDSYAIKVHERLRSDHIKMMQLLQDSQEQQKRLLKELEAYKRNNSSICDGGNSTVIKADDESLLKVMSQQMDEIKTLKVKLSCSLQDANDLKEKLKSQAVKELEAKNSLQTSINDLVKELELCKRQIDQHHTRTAAVVMSSSNASSVHEAHIVELTGRISSLETQLSACKNLVEEKSEEAESWKIKHDDVEEVARTLRSSSQQTIDDLQEALAALRSDNVKLSAIIESHTPPVSSQEEMVVQVVLRQGKEEAQEENAKEQCLDAVDEVECTPMMVVTSVNVVATEAAAPTSATTDPDPVDVCPTCGMRGERKPYMSLSAVAAAAERERHRFFEEYVRVKNENKLLKLQLATDGRKLYPNETHSSREVTLFPPVSLSQGGHNARRAAAVHPAPATRERVVVDAGRKSWSSR